MPASALRVVSVLLASTFAWAALAKVVRWARWRDALSGYELPRVVRSSAAPAVPIAEAGVAAMLLVGQTRAGAALSVALLTSFSGALLLARERRGNRLPCGCFGRATERDYRVLLARNGVLGMLSAILLTAGRDVAPAEGWTAPAGGDLLPALLVTAGIVVVAWTVWQVTSSFSQKGHR
jgi:hypothetical protein